MPSTSKADLRTMLENLQIQESDTNLRTSLANKYYGEDFKDELSLKQVVRRVKHLEQSRVYIPEDNKFIRLIYKESKTRNGKVIWRTSDEHYSTFDWYEFLD